MVALQNQYDPARVFEPTLWTVAAGGQSYVLKPKCVLDRSCFCQDDTHCADGFTCIPSAAFPQFKACFPLKS
ncbi:hypothetical protein MNEG_11027 [Monoraphidium neglectum]|jgi:hypothetical protein|uniref:L-gulonolactone oxidase 2-like C-terminal domain-containing protein n=1 Tax=Monoraphidium neglectum TaxID=145388 RepID=A0A0D2KMI6_9CHLO|nr:hypothetical protein MNEG_11027 [Monoraphidium neglectum]KIY96933.1 hypothetical protein MNEG_11027 [Monoraphidium neglectum]|eukprot:XP_013895953.1 hypothetical protein MNEG_11027 [Monoraphidium neglectum]